MPFDSRGGRGAAPFAPPTSLDALADALAARPAADESPALYCWAEHQARLREGCAARGSHRRRRRRLHALAARSHRADAPPPPTAVQAVFILRFPSAAAQKAALTRLSMFLEDATHAGAVLPAVPTGRVAGPASYSGHNCRAEDAGRFFNDAR